MRDVKQLRRFYQEPLGFWVGYYLLKYIQTQWPSLAEGQVCLGLGYAQPILEYYVSDNVKIICGMPSSMGVMRWPSYQKNLCALIQEEYLPYDNQSIDRILLLHSFEHARHPERYLRELWRILKPNGRLLLVIPNRQSLWSRVDHTPFSEGRPYSRFQIEKLLDAHMFSPVHIQGGLYFPPFRSKTLLKSSDIIERLGKRFFPSLGGVWIIECQKDVMGTLLAFKPPSLSTLLGKRARSSR
jgi:SAM-dependent methyltransferase